MTKIKPLADRVLITPDAEKEKTTGGLLLPTPSREKPVRGTVEAVGPGTEDEKMLLVPGNIVLFSKHAGFAVTNEGKQFLLMRQTECLATIEEEKL